MRSGLALLVGLLGACQSSDPHTPSCDLPRGPWFGQFEDATKASGVTFQYATPDFKAGGLAVADLDGDGLPDIVATRRIGGLVMYRNRGNLRFEKVTDSGLDPDLAANAIAAVDLDNDGDLDLVFAGLDVAYIMANQGDGTFTQVAKLTDTGWTEQILAVDLDRDGLLDLYFSNYDLNEPLRALNRVIMNHGNLALAYVAGVGAGNTWTTTAVDIDGDGDQDLYVANDTLLADFGTGGNPTSSLPPDQFLRNDGMAAGVPQFTNIADTMSITTPRSSMGGLLGDFDNDGRLDLYVPNEGAKKLFLRTPAGGYVESAAALGVAGVGRVNDECSPDTNVRECLLLSWSAALSDFDLDGYDELMVASGNTELGKPPPVLVFTRGPEAVFHEVSTDIACLDARGLVATDLDGDGDQDLVISQKEGPLVVYKNVGKPAAHSWLRVALHGHASNRMGAGAVVTLHMASGRSQLRVVGHGGVINSSLPAEAFFGLGSDGVAALDVAWPSGKHSTLTGPLDGAIVVEEDP